MGDGCWLCETPTPSNTWGNEQICWEGPKDSGLCPTGREHNRALSITLTVVDEGCRCNKFKKRDALIKVEVEKGHKSYKEKETKGNRRKYQRNIKEKEDKVKEKEEKTRHSENGEKYEAKRVKLE